MCFLAKVGGLGGTDANERVFVLLDANARTGERSVRCSDDESRILGAYGRDALNDNGERLLSFAINCKLALTDTFFSARKGGKSHTYNRTSPKNRKQIDDIFTRQAHRPRVHDVEVVPQPPPPAKANSDHNIVHIKVRLTGHVAPNRQSPKAPRSRHFDRQFLSDGNCRQRVVARVVSTLNQSMLPCTRLVRLTYSPRLSSRRYKHKHHHHAANARADGANLSKPRPPSK